MLLLILIFYNIKEIYMIFILVLMCSILFNNIKRKKEISHMIKLFFSFLYVERGISFCVLSAQVFDSLFGALYVSVFQVFAHVFAHVFAQEFGRLHKSKLYRRYRILSSSKVVYMDKFVCIMCSSICSSV